MASTTPPLGQSNQRTLAAIVFTDVVGFSARMQRDEMSTLTLLQRDFAEMYRICGEHEGAVLKTTGDGLLMKFSSAVQAVACALAMQRYFAAAAKELPPGDVLQHRVGIHLGDVVVHDQDVMGDGVNIAARLQAEAEPGGICISQTVYDVVKNKLELHVVSLGARDLKNISQSIPVYRLLMDALAPTAIPLDAAAAQRRKTRILAVAAGVVVLGAAVAFGLMARRPPAAGGPTVVASVPPAPAPSPEDEVDRAIATQMEVMQQMRLQYLSKYDFDGLARALREKNAATPGVMGASPMLIRPAEQLGTMKDWLMVNLRNYGRMRPLTVPDLAGTAEGEMKVFVAPDKRVVFLENGTPKPRELSEVKPVELGAIIVSAIRQVNPAAPRDVFAGAMAFATLYNLPKMKEALLQIRPRADKEMGPGRKK